MTGDRKRTFLEKSGPAHMRLRSGHLEAQTSLKSLCLSTPALNPSCPEFSEAIIRWAHGTCATLNFCSFSNTEQATLLPLNYGNVSRREASPSVDLKPEMQQSVSC